MSSASGQARPMRNMEVPPPGVLGPLARRACAPNQAEIRQALDLQLMLLKGNGRPDTEVCRPPLPGCPAETSAQPGLLQQLQVEVAVLREQVARLGRMARSPGLLASPFAPAAVSSLANTPAVRPAPVYAPLSFAFLQKPDTAELELLCRARHAQRLLRQRRAQAQPFTQPSFAVTA